MLNNQKLSAPLLIQDLGMQYANETSKQKRHFGMYRCRCGKSFRADIVKINSGHTKSCGCFKKQRLTKHSLCLHPLYTVWHNMVQRITNPKNKSFKDYGGRGIAMCVEWKNDFMSFYGWAINNGWEQGLSIDRRNNDGNYEPSNCRFTTKKYSQGIQE